MSSLHCLAGSSCRAAIRLEAAPAEDREYGHINEEPDTLCEPCTKWFTSAIKQLPRDYADLHQAVGEQTATSGAKIRSTPTPGVPINTAREALMGRIAETLHRAAEIVSDAVTRPGTYDGGKPLADRMTNGRRRYSGRFAAHDKATVDASIRLVEPNIAILAAFGAGIRSDDDDYAGQLDHVVWDTGETRTIIEMAGIDVALDLVELHNKTRAELGKTRLRHKYAMPCTNCGGQIGRSDGETVVTCEKCKASWTEREYKFLAGLIVDERRDRAITLHLLAEAYWRLDNIRAALGRLTPHDLELEGAGSVISQWVDQAIDGHLIPAKRVVATDRKAAEERQLDEDNWAWQNESPWRPPRRKRRRVPPPYDGPRVHPGSLSTLVDLDESVATVRNLMCQNCNQVHAGDCG